MRRLRLTISVRSNFAADGTVPTGTVILVKLPLGIRGNVINRHYVTTVVTGGVTGVKQTIAAQHVTTVL